MSFMFRLLVAIPALFLINTAWAERLNVAVASNFHTAALEIATAFEAAGEHEVTLIPGSSGKHFAQIMNGAPLHLFPGGCILPSPSPASRQGCGRGLRD